MDELVALANSLVRVMEHSPQSIITACIAFPSAWFLYKMTGVYIMRIDMKTKYPEKLFIELQEELVHVKTLLRKCDEHTAQQREINEKQSAAIYELRMKNVELAAQLNRMMTQ